LFRLSPLISLGFGSHCNPATLYAVSSHSDLDCLWLNFLFSLIHSQPLLMST
jgi:hypothetical protein